MHDISEEAVQEAVDSQGSITVDSQGSITVDSQGSITSSLNT